MKRKKSLTSIFSRLLWRELWRSWAQSLAIVAIGAIAITLFVGLQANAGALEARVEEMISLSRPADIYVTTDPHNLKAEDDKDMILSCLDEQDSLETRFYGFATLESRNAMLAVSPFFPRLSVGYDLHVSSAHSDTDYFLIDESIANDLKNEKKNKGIQDYDPIGEVLQFHFDLSTFKVSDSLLEALDIFLQPGKANPFREGKLFFSAPVSGTMKHPENTTKANPIPMISMMSNYRFRKAIVDSLRDTFTEYGASLVYRVGFYETLGWGDGNIDGGYASFPRPNQYLVQLGQGGKTPSQAKESIIAAYKAKTVNNLYTCQTMEETTFFSSLKAEVDQAHKLTYVFPVVFFVVALLVILTTLRQNILKRRTEIGSYKAMGVTPREIHAHFLTQTAALVLFASLIGAVLGPLIIPGIMGRKYSILYSLPASHYYFPIAAGIGSIALFVVISLFVTYLITYKEISLRPVESMRPKAAKVHKKLIKSSSDSHSSIALASKMAGRSIAYDPLKSIMVVIGLMGCTALLVCGFGIDNTIDHDVKTDPFVYSNFDAQPHFATGKTAAELETNLQSLENGGVKVISSYAPYDRFSVEMSHESSLATSYLMILGEPKSFDGSPEETHMVLPYSSMPKDAALISSKIADKLHVKVGDTVRFYLNKSYCEVKIHSIYEAFYGHGIVMRADATFLETPYDSFANVWVKKNPAVSEAQLKEALLTVCPLVDTISEWVTRIQGIVSSISTMTSAIKIFALLLAIVVIYNLGLLTFRERSREIATLKVLGFHTVEISISLLLEAVAMALVGVTAGLLVGFPFMKLVLSINEPDMIQFLYYIQPSTFVFATLFSLGIVVLVNAIFTYRVKKIKAMESLKSVE